MKNYFAYLVSMNEKDEQPYETYALLPLNNSVPYVTAVLYPKKNILALVSSVSRPVFEFLPKLNETGQQEVKNGIERVVRTQIQKNFDYYLNNPDDVKWFLQTQVENGDKVVAFLEGFNKTKLDLDIVSELPQDSVLAQIK